MDEISFRSVEKEQSQDLVPSYPMAYAWLVWALGAAYFFCDYLARVSPGVMVNDLMNDFQVTSFGLGTLSAYFYYPYVAMQIPVGLLVDKFGVRRLLTLMCILTGLGCFIFGSANLLSMAQLGRFLIGFAAAFAFVSTLKLASEWFPSSRFGMLAGLTQALGMLGAWVGEAPVAQSVAWYGWRNTMFIMTFLFLVLSFLIVLFVQDRPRPRLHKDNEVRVWSSLCQVFSNPQSWINGFYAGLMFAPTAVFAELWGPTYLSHVQGLSHFMSAAATGMIFLGWGLGGPLFGMISDFMGRRKPVMFLSAILGMIFLSVPLFIPHCSITVLFIFLLFYGISNNGVAIAYAVANEINPRRYAGASMAFANMMSVIVGAVLQPIVGYLIDRNAGIRIVEGVANYVPSDFTNAMFLLPLTLLLALIMCFFIKETHCRPLP